MCFPRSRFGLASGAAARSHAVAMLERPTPLPYGRGSLGRGSLRLLPRLRFGLAPDAARWGVSLAGASEWLGRMAASTWSKGDEVLGRRSTIAP